MIHVLHDPRMGVNAYACARTESLSPGLHTSPLRAAFAPTGAFGSVPQLFSHSPGYSPLRLEKHLTSPHTHLILHKTPHGLRPFQCNAPRKFSATLCARTSSTISRATHGHELLTGIPHGQELHPPSTQHSHPKCNNDAMKCALAGFPGARWPTGTKD